MKLGGVPYPPLLGLVKESQIRNVSDYAGSIWAMTPDIIIARAWGWISLRTGSLLISAGLHFANHFGDVFLVGTEGDIIGTVAPCVASMPS